MKIVVNRHDETGFVVIYPYVNGPTRNGETHGIFMQSFSTYADSARNAACKYWGENWQKLYKEGFRVKRAAMEVEVDKNKRSTVKHWAKTGNVNVRSEDHRRRWKDEEPVEDLGG